MGAPGIDGMGNRAAWSFNKHFLDHRTELEVALKQCVDGIETSLKDLSDELRASWAGWHSAAYLEDTLSYSLYDTLHSLRGVLDDTKAAERLEKIREDSTVFYQRWFNTRGGRRAAASAIVLELSNRLGPAIGKERERATSELTNEVNEHLATMATQLTGVQHTRLRDLESLTQGKADHVRERESVVADITATRAILARLDGLLSSVEDALTAQE